MDFGISILLVGKTGAEKRASGDIIVAKFKTGITTHQDQMQVVELLDKIKQTTEENGEMFYTNEMYQGVDYATRRKEDELRQYE
ncbi:hypothetical protein NFI96_000921 [Prochilodus magdalenae]|nr:hypothetical protein NFI96_000921 [Prochilodus magdalenae]